MLSRRVTAFLPMLPLVCVGAWVFAHSALMIRSDLASASARYHIAAWTGGKQQWNVPQWLDARDGLEAAIRITPENPMLYDYLGALYAFRGNLASRNVGVRTVFFEQAVPYQQKSIELRPHNASAWANYAHTLYMLGVRDDRLQEAERHAIALGQYESGVRRTVQDVMLGSWQSQPTDLQAWMQQSVCEMNAEGLTHLAQQTAALGISNLSAKDCSTATARSTSPAGALVFSH